MILKFLAIAAVLFVVYLLFFKKNREKDIKKDNTPDQIEDVMFECPTCGTYVSKDDAILSNGKYYCTSACLRK